MKNVAVTALIITAVFALTASNVMATVTVTAATGGSAISADTTGGTFTSLMGPVISEGATADIGTGTIILNVPSGFVFDTGGTAPMVLVTRIAGSGANNRNINNLASGSTIAVTRTATTLTITIIDVTSSGVRNSLTWQNVRVRPSAGTPLASGNITKSGASAISGVTGSTNFGTLTEVPGAKNKLTITVQPSSSVTAGIDFTTKPIVAVQDQFGNTVTSDNSSTVARTAVLSTQVCGGTIGSGTLTSTPASGASVTAGVMTYTAMSYSFGEGIKVCFTSTGITSALSNAVTVNNPVPAITSINPTSKNVGNLAFTLTVNGSGFVSNSVVRLNGSDRATTFVSAIKLTASIPASDLASAGISIVTVFNPAPGGGASNSENFTVIQVATKFVILPPGNGTVDSPITVTIRAQKPDNSVDINWQQGVTLNASGSATGGGLVTIVNGMGTKQISDTVAETVHLSLTDSQSTGLDVSSTADITFNVGALAQYALSHPGNAGAGTRATYTLTREDQYGNPVISGTSTAYFYSNSSSPNKKFYDAAVGGNVITSIAVSNGASGVSFWYYDEALGNWTVTASDNSSAPDGNTGVIDAVDTITIVTGPVSQFTLNNPGGMTAGTRLGYTATRKDQFGNLVTSGFTTGYLYSVPATVGTSTAFFDAAVAGSQISSIGIVDTNSSADFWYYQNTPGTYTLTVSDNSSAPDGSSGIVDATSSVNVMAAPIVATRFVIIAATSTTVDFPLTVTIQAQDNGGNIDTSASSSVTLLANGSATGAGLVALTNGVGTIQISDHLVETVHLSLSDTQGTGLNVSSTADVTFNPGAVVQFALNNPGDTAAGTRLGYTVTRKDQYGNLAIDGATTVYLYSSSLGTNRFYSAASGGSVIVSVVISDGQSSANFWYYDEKAGTWNAIVSDNAVSPDGPAGIADALQAVTVQPAAIYKFILNNPGNMTAGTRLGYTVTRQDQFDNPVTSGVTLGYFYTSSTGTSTKFYDAAAGGNVITFAVFNDGQSSANFWYYDASPGIWNVTVSDSTPSPNGASGVIDAVDTVTVSAAPIVATRFVILPVPVSLIDTDVTVTIRAEDNSGNVQTTYNNSITLSAGGSATGSGVVAIINGIGTAVIRNAVAESVILSLADSNSTGLDISSTQTAIFTAQLSISGGFIGGGGLINMPGVFSQPISGVVLSGTAFPGARIKVIAYATSIPIATQSTVASYNGDFAFSFSDFPVGSRSYGIVATDRNSRVTQTKIFDAKLSGVRDMVYVDGIMLSPTLGFVSSAVRKGDNLALVGYSSPGYSLEIEVDGNLTDVKAAADGQGFYRILVNTAGMDLGTHTVRVRQINPSNTRSDFSPQKIFIVTDLFVPKVDFNNDGAVNIQDWSTFLSRWVSDNPQARALDDLNDDGKVDISDFSIFVRTLKLGQ